MVRRALTFPNVVALICLFVVLGGPAVAANTVKRALFAKKAGNADKVDGFHASSKPRARTLLPLDSDGRFPQSVLPPGAVGPQGPAGERGETGAQGARGDTGAAGPKGDRGEPGTDGTSFFWRGPWDELAGYAPGDAVSHQGSAYIATASGTGNVPADDQGWDLMAAAGAAGAPGAPGQPGAVGPAGPPGTEPPPPPPPNYSAPSLRTSYSLTILGPGGETLSLDAPSSFGGCRIKRLPLTDLKTQTTTPGEYEDCHFTLLGFPPSVREWLTDSYKDETERLRSFTLRTLRSNGDGTTSVVKQLEVTDAFLSAFELPDPDEEAQDPPPGVVKIVAVPRRVTSVAPSPAPAQVTSRAAPPAETVFNPRDFRLTISGVEPGTINAIGRLAIDISKIAAPVTNKYVQFTPGTPAVKPFSFGTAADSNTEAAPRARDDLEQWGAQAESGADARRDAILELRNGLQVLHTLNLRDAVPLSAMSPFPVGFTHPMVMLPERVTIDR